jgi:hypothetical protein
MTPLHFTKEIVMRIVDEFPQCIECGDDHLASHPPTYFHKDFCLRGAGLDAATLIKRMTERWLELLRREDARLTHLPMTKSLSCRDCGARATGTGWVAYHNKTSVLEAFPLCDAHAYFDDKDNRPHGFVPGVITTDTTAIQCHLSGEVRKEEGGRSAADIYKGMR